MFARGVRGGALVAFHVRHALAAPKEPGTPRTALRDRNLSEDESALRAGGFFVSCSHGTDECVSEWSESTELPSPQHSEPRHVSFTSHQLLRPRFRALPLVPRPLEDRLAFLTNPLPEACGAVQCHVWEGPGPDGPRFFLSMEAPSQPHRGPEREGAASAASRELLLCAAAKVSDSLYHLSMDDADFAAEGRHFIGRCQVERQGADCRLALGRDEEGPRPGTSTISVLPASKDEPAKVAVMLRAPAASTPHPGAAQPAFQAHWLRNTPPAWNQQRQTYELEFGPRVRMPCARNMQLEEELWGNRSIIRLTFGKMDAAAYCLDFSFPFSVAQAFALALVSLHAL
eukprot:EG_transcript_3770